MNICKRCGALIRRRIKTDGKVRNLKNRKYCFKCSPPGLHNTRKLHLPEWANYDPSSPKTAKRKTKQSVCTICGKKYLSYPGSFIDTCDGCRVTACRKRMKERAVKYKGGKCSRCGYDKCIRALEFHHRDPSLKEFDINGRGSSIEWGRLQNELDKCDILCANCHREIEPLKMWQLLRPGSSIVEPISYKGATVGRNHLRLPDDKEVL
jgi:hypothetical protein